MLKVIQINLVCSTGVKISSVLSTSCGISDHKAHYPFQELKNINLSLLAASLNKIHGCATAEQYNHYISEIIDEVAPIIEHVVMLAY